MVSKAPGSSLMAALTDCEIIAAKRALSIVTRHATLPRSGCVMIERLRLSHLAPLWHIRSNLMTLVARFLLMLCVTKTDSKSLRKSRGARVAAKLMTSAARRDITPGGLRSGHVTAIASGMGVEARRY
jgi:hypothetical protein